MIEASHNSQLPLGDMLSNEQDDRKTRTRNSALWAAYGDALGFISELVSSSGLRRRTNGSELNRLMPWERRVGGRGGVQVRLPAGCWSDDTQLRMAVSRAINRHGFDTEAFARVELPVWPSYALGGGRASKLAAKNLGKPKTLWYANTFPKWSEAGGNGAAMRIQPHVWSSIDLSGDYMTDVMADGICTHGHLRAIVGACYHAATLAHCLRDGRVPDPGQCLDIAGEVHDAFSVIENHRTIGSTWKSVWEHETGKNLLEEWRTTVCELRAAIEQASDGTDKIEDTADAYRAMSERLGLEARDQRGSGVLTSVAAAALAGLASDAHEAVVVAANALRTDTDTIATMAGALLGACSDTGEPPEEVLDRAYLIREADRLFAVSQGRDVDKHSYPDLLTWTAPQTQADALATDDSRWVVEGLGPVTKKDEAPSWTTRQDFGWQWVQTGFGQTLLIKRRRQMRSLSASNSTEPAPEPITMPRSRRTTSSSVETQRGRDTEPISRPADVDRAVEFARRHIDDDRHIGYTVREVAQRGTLADLAVLVTEIRNDLRRVPAK